jgi:uncharacterized protein YkwD
MPPTTASNPNPPPPVVAAAKLPRTAFSMVVAVVAALVLVLAGCGGGDEAAGAQPGASDPLAPAAGSAGGGAAVATCGLANFEAELLQRVNARRATGASCGSRGSFAATAPLSWNAALAQAAGAHSLDMAALSYFSHTSADGRTLADRVRAAGYGGHLLAENIAAGYPSVQAVVDGWMASDAHCANILNPGLRDIGVACAAAGATDRYANYWTMDLGAP